jgi:hypothetical protein
MTDPKYQHGSSEAGWMEQNETPRTDDQFRDTAKMVPTDCCNSAPEKRLADGIRYWDCAKCGATVWIENPIKDHTEQHLDMVSYTPRTDAFVAENSLLAFSDDKYELTTVHARQLERELAASKAEVERLQTLPESRHKAFLDLLERAEKAEAEVAKLNHQLIKTESDLLQSQDINSFLDTEFRIACKRAEKAEAEVEMLDHLLADASETNHKLAAEVLVLKKQVAALRSEKDACLDGNGYYANKIVILNDRINRALDILTERIK